MKLFKNCLHIVKISSNELFFIFLLFSLFADLSLLSPFTNARSTSILGIAVVLLSNIFLLITLGSWLGETKTKSKKIKLSLSLIPISAFTTIRIFFLDSTPRWDSSVYFQALRLGVKNLSIDFKPIINGFNWTHPTLGWSLITSILQIINPNNIFLLNLTNTLLGIIAIYSFYKIIGYFYRDRNKTENVIATTLFAINPLFIATSTAFLPDYGVLVFTLTTFALFLYKKPLLALFSACLLVFSKETGAYIYLLLVSSYLMQTTKFANFKIKEILKRVLPLTIPLLLLLSYYLLLKGNIWAPDGHKAISIGVHCRFCFGFKTYNAINNIYLFFILNFSWILSLVILFGIISLIFLAKNKAAIIQKQNIALLTPLFVAPVGFVIFFLFYIIYIIPSYIAVFTFFITFWFYFFTRLLIKSKKIRIGLLAIVIFLFAIENFVTIDPVSKQIFGTLRIGDHQFLTIGTEYLGDGMIYNTQYVYEDRLIAKFIIDNDVSPTDTIFIDPYAWGNFYNNWGHFSSIQPKIISSLENLKKYPVNLYYLDFPLMQYGPKDETKIQDSYVPPLIEKATILEMIQKYYKLQSSKKLDIHGYAITVYKFTLK